MMNTKYFLVLLIVLNGIVVASGAAAAETLVMGGTGLAIGLARELADVYGADHPEVLLEVLDSLGSSGGIRAVAGGTLALAFSARPLHDDEKAQGLEDIPILRTPYVLAVSSDVGDDLDLSSDDIRHGYDGRLTAWPDGTPMRFVVRNESDSSTQILEQRFEGLGPILDRARQARGALVAYTDQESMDLAEQTPGTVTTAALLAILAEGRRLRPIAIDGIAPTVDNLRTGRYSMDVTLQVVLGPQSGDGARDFVAFVQSDTGRDVLERLGCLPVAMGVHD